MEIQKCLLTGKTPQGKFMLNVLQTGGCKDVYCTRLKQSVGGAAELRVCEQNANLRIAGLNPYLKIYLMVMFTLEEVYV